MESRMRGNSHVRFGAGDEETCLGDEARRFIPTLPAKPVRTLTLKGKREPFREMAEEPTPAIPGEEALLLASAVAGGAHWL